MHIREVQQSWDDWGRLDAFCSIMGRPDKFGHKMTVEEFFASGREQIAATIAHSERLSLPLAQVRTVLDFGCGAGRLTQALAAHFPRVHGVDIAPSMIDLARQHNQHPDTCTYHLNTAPNLYLFADHSFDMVYSFGVLQHMQPHYFIGYIQEFIRVLKPGGLLVFQLPHRPSNRAYLIRAIRAMVPVGLLGLYRKLRTGCDFLSTPKVEACSLPRRDVLRLLTDQGIHVRDVQAHPSPAWKSLQYYGIKATTTDES